MKKEKNPEISKILDQMENKRRGKEWFFERFIPRKVDYNPDDEDLSDKY